MEVVPRAEAALLPQDVGDQALCRSRETRRLDDDGSAGPEVAPDQPRGLLQVGTVRNPVCQRRGDGDHREVEREDVGIGARGMVDPKGAVGDGLREALVADVLERGSSVGQIPNLAVVGIDTLDDIAAFGGAYREWEADIPESDDKDPSTGDGGHAGVATRTRCSAMTTAIGSS